MAFWDSGLKKQNIKKNGGKILLFETELATKEKKEKDEPK